MREQLTEEELKIRYAYAWSTEDIKYDWDIKALGTELTFANKEFVFSEVNFYQEKGLYSNRDLYVLLKKYNGAEVVLNSPVYTVGMNDNSFGILSNIDSSVSSFSENEYIEIRTCFESECTDTKLISRQYLHPLVLDLCGW